MSLSFLYCTDLHGKEGHYSALLTLAQRLGVYLIHLGADILPKGRGNLVQTQRDFVENGLRAFHMACRMSGIKVFSFFGNDDVYALKDLYKTYAPLLDEFTEKVSKYEFKAYGYVPDYPFPLKTACKIDHPGWVRPECDRGTDVDSKGNITRIANIDKYLAAKGTIQEDLANIRGTRNLVMATHTPPNGLGLDAAGNPPRYVGSQAVREWIELENPLLVLSGHIHESPRITGIWRATVGNTVIVQPGQEEDRLVAVFVELNGEKIRVERHTVKV